jgi:outer membrane protein
MLKISIFLSTVSLIAVVVLGVYVYKMNDRLVYVNTTKLLESYKGMQDARASYSEKLAIWKANTDSLATDLQRRIDEYKKKASKLSEKEKELTEELLAAKQKQLVEYQNATSMQARQEDTQMTSMVINQINAFLKDYGDAQGYKIVLAATEYGNVAYAEEGLDITEKVIEELNKRYKK